MLAGRSIIIIFVDIVGFTELSSKLRPSELVTILDSIFRRFDLICERYGAEKIKTIGDGYMAATGSTSSKPGRISFAAES